MLYNLYKGIGLQYRKTHKEDLSMLVVKTDTYFINTVDIKTDITGDNDFEVISNITGEVHFFKTFSAAKAFASDPANLE